jgi:hypothetical protein
MAATHHAYQGDIILRQDSITGGGGTVYNASDDLHHAGLDEMQLVQLQNGSVMAFARNCADATGSMKNCMMVLPATAGGAGNLTVPGGHRVMVSVSHSGGEHWSKPR